MPKNHAAKIYDLYIRAKFQQKAEYDKSYFLLLVTFLRNIIMGKKGI